MLRILVLCCLVSALAAAACGPREPAAPLALTTSPASDVTPATTPGDGQSSTATPAATATPSDTRTPPPPAPTTTPPATVTATPDTAGPAAIDVGAFDIVANDTAPVLDGTPLTLPEVILPRAGSIYGYSDAGLDPSTIVGMSEPLPAGHHRDVAIPTQAMETSGTLYLVFFVDANNNGIADVENGDPVAAWPDGQPLILGVLYEAPPKLEPETRAAIDVGTTPLESDGRGVTVESVTLDAPGFVVAWDAKYGPTGEAIGVSAYLPAGTSEHVAVTFPALLAASRTLAIGVVLDDPKRGTQGVFEFWFDHLAPGTDDEGVWSRAEVVVRSADPDPEAERFVTSSLPEPEALGPGWAPMSDAFVEPLTRPPAESKDCVAFNQASLDLQVRLNASRTAQGAGAYYLQLADSPFAEIKLSVEFDAFPDDALPRAVVELYRAAYTDGTLERCLREGAAGPTTKQTLVRIDPSVDPGEAGAAFAYGWTNEDQAPMVAEQYLWVRGSMLVYVVFSAPGADPATVQRLIDTIQHGVEVAAAGR